jgi:hypothetical protein
MFFFFLFFLIPKLYPTETTSIGAESESSAIQLESCKTRKKKHPKGKEAGERMVEMGD